MPFCHSVRDLQPPLPYLRLPEQAGQLTPARRCTHLAWKWRRRRRQDARPATRFFDTRINGVTVTPLGRDARMHHFTCQKFPQTVARLKRLGVYGGVVIHTEDSETEEKPLSDQSQGTGQTRPHVHSFTKPTLTHDSLFI